jgi:hypothetical protein
MIKWIDRSLRMEILNNSVMECFEKQKAETNSSTLDDEQGWEFGPKRYSRVKKNQYAIQGFPTIMKNKIPFVSHLIPALTLYFNNNQNGQNMEGIIHLEMFSKVKYQI